VVEGPLSEGAGGLIKVLLDIVQYMRAGQKSEISSLQQLAERKFKAMASTHQLFVSLLRDLRFRAVQLSKRVEEGTNSLGVALAFNRTTDAVQAVRSESIPLRRADYEEASVYAENDIKYQGLFVNIPNDIARELKEFMSSYRAYFVKTGEYKHELQRILEACEHYMQPFSQGLRKNSDNAKRDLQGAFNEIVEEIDESLKILDGNWATAARAYHQLQFCFREHGIS
jgi:hypothetical protein